MERKQRFRKWILVSAIASVTSVGLTPFIPIAFAATLPASDAPPVTSSGVVQVFNAAQLEYIDQNQNLYLSSNIELMNNIDLRWYNWLPIGWRISGTDAGGTITYTSSSPESVFSGTFNGQGHVITGLAIDDTTDQDVGFFGIASGTIENVGIDGQVTTVTVTGGLPTNAGMIAGALRLSGSIINSYAMGAVSQGSSNGGLVGNSDGNISDSYSMVNVSGPAANGGLVGNLYVGNITDSYAVGKVSGGVYNAGVIGVYAGGAYTGDYFDANTTGAQQGIGSFSGIPPTSIMGSSTSEMQTPSTFTGWNTSNWALFSGYYPLLKWQIGGSMSATPTTVSPGGQVTVTGSVYFSGGSPLPGINTGIRTPPRSTAGSPAASPPGGRSPTPGVPTDAESPLR